MREGFFIFPFKDIEKAECLDFFKFLTGILRHGLAVIRSKIISKHSAYFEPIVFYTIFNPLL
jgi:hypothetical protein